MIKMRYKNNLKSLLIIFVSSFLFLGCEYIGDQLADLPSIKYPDTGNYGDNLLRADNVNIVSGPTSGPPFYSFCVEIGGGANVKVVLPSSDTDGEYYFAVFPNRFGWVNLEAYPYNPRIFYTDKAGQSDIQFNFKGHGSRTLEIYENNAETPTRTKTLTW
jgi:hypothetical protein